MQIIIAVIGIGISFGFFSFVSGYDFSKIPNYLRWIISPIMFIMAVLLSRVLFGSWFWFLDAFDFMTFEIVHYYFLLILIYPLQSIVIPITQVFAGVYTAAKIAPKLRNIVGYLAAILCLIPLAATYLLIHQSSISSFMNEEIYFFLTNISEYSNTPFWTVMHIISTIFGSIAAIFLLYKRQEPFGFLLKKDKPK